MPRNLGLGSQLSLYKQWCRVQNMGVTLSIGLGYCTDLKLISYSGRVELQYRDLSSRRIVHLFWKNL